MQREFTSSIPEFEFKTIKAAGESFWMGSPENYVGRHNNENGKDGKQVKVSFEKDFEIMTTEVAQKQWFDVMGDNPSFYKEKEYCRGRGNHTRKKGYHGEAVQLCLNHPIERVSWNMAQIFIEKLNKLAGVSGCEGSPKDPSGCYRLPTEAEWEYVAKGKTTTAYSFDLDLIDDYAWHKGNSSTLNNPIGQTYPVGQKLENPYGVFDMHGNVWEWTQDSWQDFLVGGIDPFHTDSGFLHTARGGGWANTAWHLRSAIRRGFLSGSEYADAGFRLMRAI